MHEPFYTRHRGPYQLVLWRPGTKPKASPLSEKEVFKTLIAGDEVEEEALALLNDPRDTIQSIEVWSVTETQHVMSYFKGKEMQSND